MAKKKSGDSGQWPKGDSWRHKPFQPRLASSTLGALTANELAAAGREVAAACSIPRRLPWQR